MEKWDTPVAPNYLGSNFTRGVLQPLGIRKKQAKRHYKLIPRSNRATIGMARLRGNHSPDKALTSGNVLRQHSYSRMGKYTVIKEVNHSKAANTSARVTTSISTSLPHPHNFHRRREK